MQIEIKTSMKRKLNNVIDRHSNAFWQTQHRYKLFENLPSEIEIKI